MDDNTEKVTRISKVLTDRCLVIPENIETAGSLNSGRDKLSKNFYDLLILDLVLPVSDGDEIEPGKSEGFINELSRIGRYKKPIYIIGLSEYQEKVEQNADKFEDKLWKLIHYNMKTEDWEVILQCAVDSILSTKGILLKSIINKNKYDFGIICALSEEFEQMKESSNTEWKKMNVSNINIDFFTTEIRSELGHSLKIIAARNNMAGMQAASVMAATMYSLFDVNAIFMTGICAGFKKPDDDMDFGDIFIAESEYDYGSGKLTETENGFLIKPEPKQIECSFDLQSKINTFKEICHKEVELPAVLKKKNLNYINRVPKIFFNPGACGSYVVGDKSFMQSLVDNNNRKLRGLDMEGYGLYLAAHMLGRQALMIKCISDYADSDKGDDYHIMCAFSSAWFLFEFLKYTY
jgi:Nucleoside phosphorylase